MRDLRVLLVDDEPLVREGLRDLLEAEPGIVVAGEATNGLDALTFLDEHPVDLLFLDIAMPELDGLGVAEALARDDGPMIVFITAFSEHAIRAFEVNAVDYLLKPFDQARLRAALGRVRARRAPGDQAALTAQLAAALHELRRDRGVAERLLVKDGGRISFVAVDQIDWVEAADNYVRLHVGDTRHFLRETIRSLEARLPADRFVRIHRSTIVNVARIRELQSTFNGEYTVSLTSGAKLTLSRGYRDAVRARLGGEF